MSKKYLTLQGLRKIQKELEYLKNVRRKELAEQLEKAISYGDISENAEFQEAKDAQAFLEGRILELEEIANSAEVMPAKSSEGVVQIGSTILISTRGGKEQFQIVGPEEANPLDGKISMDSPLGRSVLNRPEGTEVSVETPEGKRRYKIVKIA